ncbi:hypothetical protein JR316_0011136 [Psilocybe cubensis]|uniref:Uncharacterized protein n=1 Tax=Psilocybe cubensis TaxID=181762 RepID=A0ACB8GP78_PSICU|nr:hypothetical protein JR316_0011136 [Psilocybe cubensis]KAH9477217.1 hypothetical protein JR316_0011136 [Psilocybe cubensis]
MSSKIVSSLILALSLSLPSQALLKGNAIAAFSGPNCDGNMGAIVNCDSSCHQFTGRQSTLTGSPGTHCIRYFKGDGCTSYIAATLSGPNECRKVAVGLGAKSFSTTEFWSIVDPSSFKL